MCLSFVGLISLVPMWRRERSIRLRIGVVDQGQVLLDAIPSSFLERIHECRRPPHENAVAEFVRVFPTVVANLADQLSRIVVVEQILLPEIDDQIGTFDVKMRVEPASILKERSDW